jgi:hypothetical protein
VAQRPVKNPKKASAANVPPRLRRMMKRTRKKRRKNDRACARNLLVAARKIMRMKTKKMKTKMRRTKRRKRKSGLGVDACGGMQPPIELARF